ncbi:biliverdin-producing heme oxygenase [Nonlabens ponticola]|uniref:Biliverdin-producing heme oxygenase n=1 Tax=Nonlabens ponticola TaxID=2496866 RepID=A0A3S9MVK5_9FLAO|nr:biliverdin-producing heme oxygenase [Nonlabens ponticola]AZQ43256.1 hypothetical protein EJ995_03025 [Nonlabens ponticola]
MSILNRLREETRPAHIDLEQVSGAHRIMDHSITLSQYKKLLQANYHAYAKAESHLSSSQNNSIAAWILADLQAIDPTFTPRSYKPQSATIENQLGIKYVIEGSLLGGAMIAQHIKQCEHLAHLPDQQFYAAGTPQRAMRWRQFMKEMKAVDFSKEQQDKIVNQANETFNWFAQEFNKSR